MTPSKKKPPSGFTTPAALLVASPTLDSLAPNTKVVPRAPAAAQTAQLVEATTV